MTTVEPDVVGVRVHLPPEAETEHGWTDEKIVERWQGTVAKTVREYWLDRVNATAGYLDLTQDGLPASQLHAQAKAMLAYWDKIVADEDAEVEEVIEGVSRSRKIRRV